jgi:hypothetical protein
MALSPCLGLAEFDDVMLLLALSLAIVDTDLIWTKIAYLSKSWHLSLLTVVE